MAKMIMLVVLCAGALAAPPAPQQQDRIYQQPGPGLQQLNMLDYYLDNADVGNYYNSQQQQQLNEKQAQLNANQNGAPSRLESLEPDSEVELLPGAQQPQQPPQQNPVSPNIPGLIPGQRVYIVHMPVAGYRPGSVGGYQPVYVVAAAPGNGNGNYGPNGYQNTLLIDPSGQGISPYLGYPGVLGQGNPGILGQGNPGYLVAGGNQLGLSRPYNLLYQNPGFGYSQGQGVGGHLINPQGTVRLAQLIHLQAQPGQAANLRDSAKESNTNNAQSSRLTESSESKESQLEERKRSHPAPAHAAKYSA